MKLKKFFDRLSLDFKKLKLIVSQENWLEIYNCPSISEAFGMFMTKIQSYVSASTNRVKVNNKFLKPWINADIIKFIKEKINCIRK